MLPLGGISGLNALFAVIREIPKFAVLPRALRDDVGAEISDKITISTVNFGDDVRIFFHFWLLLSLLLFGYCIIFHFIFIQVFQINNADYEEINIYLAGSSLYLLLQIEAQIKGYVRTITPESYEEKFNGLVNEAVSNYKAFLNNNDDNPLKFEMLSNFDDLFSTCIDVKKKEIADATLNDTNDDTNDDQE